jgi:ribose 5-phosphate isomerase B
MKKIVFACDHAGVDLKNALIELAEAKGFSVEDLGPYSNDRVDYPDYGFKLANTVADGNADLGVLICGTGVGMSIVANKVKGVRACVCSEPFSAQMSREHNNANVLCLGARVVGEDLAKLIVSTWLDAEFQGGRHETRVNKIES